jgi:hypothetical protein
MNSHSAKSSSTFPDLLSRLLLPPLKNTQAYEESKERISLELKKLNREEFDAMLDLAQTNHVIVRGMQVFRDLSLEQQDRVRAEWAGQALEAEFSRIENAIGYLFEICAAFEERHCDVTVIKSLDHWPDIGSDLDLYTSATPNQVLALMTERFNAKVAARSWGDRLAHKWNFMIPGLPEAVEIHVGRLGQTGEQVTVAASLPARSRLIEIEGRPFRVASIPDRIAISTLQRMYRHFYFRLCDVIDTARIADAGEIDYENLRLLTGLAGIWEGVATYLAIVSDYVTRYRGFGLSLPAFVNSDARFRGDQIYYARGFLRVPIMPQSARLYGSQLAGVLARGELQSGARLSLLPWLAAAAVVGQKLTGSDKGIW